MSKLRKTILEEKQDNLRKEIKAQMVYLEISSLTKLAPRINLTENQLCDRMKGKKQFNHMEIALMAEVLHFSDEQKLKII